jgi:hypothetical protein
MSMALVRNWAGDLMVLALAGAGQGTHYRAFKGLGIKPSLGGLGAALVVGLVSYIDISLLRSLVTRQHEESRENEVWVDRTL